MKNTKSAPWDLKNRALGFPERCLQCFFPTRNAWISFDMGVTAVKWHT